MTDKAVERMKELIEARNTYFEFLKVPEEKHCLMFPEDDGGDIGLVSPEKANAYVTSAFEKLAQSPKLQKSLVLQELWHKL